MLSWLDIGDPHVTGGNEQTVRYLREIVTEANAHLAGSVDFALLPGDITNEGTPEQYRLVRETVDDLRLPLYAIPGDHDVASGDLAGYHGTFDGGALPRRARVGDCRWLGLNRNGRQL